MIVNEDGGVTGSIDVSQLDQVEPKTDEARAQLDALKAERDAGQAQAARDAERLAEQARAQNPLARQAGEDAGADTRDAQGKELEGRPQGGGLQQAGSQQADAGQQQRDAERQQREADERARQQSGQQSGQEDDLDALRSEAEAAGVTVDKRWGADRLRQETQQAQAAQSRKR